MTNTNTTTTNPAAPTGAAVLATMQAVRLHEYGGPEVLRLDTVPTPEPGPREVLVRVEASGINPGEIAVRQGAMAEVYPMPFPFGEGSDLAGTAVRVGDGVTTVAPGDPVFGWSDERAAHAEYVVVPQSQVARRPEGIALEQAAGLYVVGATAIAAVRAVEPQPGETVVISGAAGGVGVLATQLAVRTGARVIGLASTANHAWLEEHGAVAATYGDGWTDRVRDLAPDGVDAFIDLFGGGYVDLALDVLGVSPERVDTIIDFEAAGRRGVKTDGNAAGASIENLLDLAERIASGELDLPIASTYPLAEVRAAYEELGARHTRGKVVLLVPVS